MATVKQEQKTVVLLSPHRLLTDYLLLSALHIIKSPGNVEYKEQELDHAAMRNYFESHPRQVKEALVWFNQSGMNVILDDIKKKFTAQKAGVAFEPYFNTALMRRLHELLHGIRSFTGDIKWYHKLPQEKGRFKTGPCFFSSHKPQLKFDVTDENGALQLNTIVVIEDVEYPYKDFTRYRFLLQRNNEYFLPGFKDYQTLEWLHDNDPQQYSHQPQELAQQILTRLEADYTVNRNNLFDKQEIQALPVNRVMLSEISQSFLMLTPQWTYDGILVEGAWQPVYEFVRNGEHYSVQRNKEQEKDFLQLLESLHENFRKQLNGYYYVSFADAKKKQWFLKVYHRLLEMNIEVIGMDMLQHFRYSSHKVKADIKVVQETDSMLSLQVKVFFGKDTVPLAELQKTLRAGQRAILLNDGSLGILDDEWQQQYGAIIRHGKITDDHHIQVSRWLAFAEQKATEETQVLKPIIQKDWWQQWQQWQQTDEPVCAVPASVKASLRPYQQKGFEWMVLLAGAGAGACLADDMGLGKTLQTICFLAYQSAQRPGAKHLVVCPSSLIYNWQQELEKFAAHLPVLVHHGAGRDAAALQQAPQQVIITSYGTVRIDIEQLVAIPFATVVLDESHNIKNPASQTTRAVNQLQATTRIALSGTPVMNNTFDLYAQLNFLLPGLFGSREFFKREYADAIDRDQDADKIRELQRLTAPFVLRRTKEQVEAELPVKTETVLWCTMGAAQKELYDAIKNDIRSSVFLNIKEQGLGKSKLAVLQGMLKLRQVCNSPQLLPQDEQTCIDSVKTTVLLDELVNNLKGHKVLVFSQFTGMLDLLAAHLAKEAIPFYHFDGQTAPVKRTEMVNAFQEAGNTVPVFLISLKAGNAGLNLTAANYVFLFDPWWNTAVQQQAIDRAHRIGQTKSVFAYKMICRDTIEEKIIALQERKKMLADELVSAEEGFVKALTEDDIAYLFS
jgi:SNF2 family DNA or RNA helicase